MFVFVRAPPRRGAHVVAHTGWSVVTRIAPLDVECSVFLNWDGECVAAALFSVVFMEVEYIQCLKQ